MQVLRRMPSVNLLPAAAAAAAGALAVSVVLAPQAEASTYATSAFISDTNHARINHDRRAYRVRDHLNDVAQRWANWMASHQTLRHNPYLTSQVSGWRELGENVGRGGSEGAIQRAFMNSTYHRDNILCRCFTLVGVGTARGADGKLYVDEIFKKPA